MKQNKKETQSEVVFVGFGAGAIVNLNARNGGAVAEYVFNPSEENARAAADTAVEINAALANVEAWFFNVENVTERDDVVAFMSGVREVVTTMMVAMDRDPEWMLDNHLRSHARDMHARVEEMTGRKIRFAGIPPAGDGQPVVIAASVEQQANPCPLYDGCDIRHSL